MTANEAGVAFAGLLKAAANLADPDDHQTLHDALRVQTANLTREQLVAVVGGFLGVVVCAFRWRGAEQVRALLDEGDTFA